MPVFFLYFSATVSLREAIELGAIYYLSVVLFEVPSGYLSDRIGRRTTLMTAAVFAIVSYITFIAASTFQVFALGQVLLAGAIAFQSGSDNSLLYDSLAAAQREGEYSAHEARAHQYNLFSLAFSVLLGGFLGTINLKYAYIAALAAAITTFFICMRFTEPTRVDDSKTQAFLPQLKIATSAAKQPALLWILAFYITGYSLQHIPYEFYQPYIALLKDNPVSDLLKNQHVAMVSGVVIGLSMFGGAFGARASESLRVKFGARNVLIAGLSIQCLIIAIMALLLHPAILLIIIFRNFSMAMTHAPMHAIIAPRVKSAQRATYLSLQSLAGRLAFSLMLFAIAGNSSQTLTWPALSWIFKVSVVLGVVALVVLVVFSKPVDVK